MDVLIVEDDLPAQVALAQEMMRRGLGVICMSDLDSAEAMLRHQVPRAVILGEWVGGRLSHRLALMAECRRPDVMVILLTVRTGTDLDEMPDLLPAVRAILGRDFTPDSVGQIVAAVLNPGGITRISLRGSAAVQRPPVPQVAAQVALPLPEVGAAQPLPQAAGAGQEDEPAADFDPAAAPLPAEGSATAKGPPLPAARFWPLAAYRVATRQAQPDPTPQRGEPAAPGAEVSAPLPDNVPASERDTARPPRVAELRAIPPPPEMVQTTTTPDTATLRKVSLDLAHLEPGQTPAAPRPRATSPAAFDWPAWLAAAAAQEPSGPAPSGAGPVTVDPSTVTAPQSPSWDLPLAELADPPRKVASGRRLTLG